MSRSFYVCMKCVLEGYHELHHIVTDDEETPDRCPRHRRSDGWQQRAVARDQNSTPSVRFIHAGGGRAGAIAVLHLWINADEFQVLMHHGESGSSTSTNRIAPADSRCVVPETQPNARVGLGSGKKYVPTIGAERALVQQLRVMFTVERLRTLVRELPFGEPAFAELPSGSCSLSAMSSAVVEICCQHGLIDDRFFDEMVAARPKREEEIREIQALWLS